jgi:hypothetical protein
MKTIKVISWDDITDNFTGIAEYPNGTKHWLKKGNFHRKDGPAIEHTNGKKEWWNEGNLHRINGPAIEYSDGSKSWWVDNVWYTVAELKDLIEDSIYLGKEKGKYDLDWLRFLTEKGIKGFPIVAEMEQDNCFIPLFNKVFGATNQ